MLNLTTHAKFGIAIHSFVFPSIQVLLFSGFIVCEKICFLHIRKTKAQISCEVPAQLISTFVGMSIKYVDFLNSSKLFYDNNENLHR